MTKETSRVGTIFGTGIFVAGGVAIWRQATDIGAAIFLTVALFAVYVGVVGGIVYWQRPNAPTDKSGN